MGVALGVTFAVTLIPALIAIGYTYYKTKKVYPLFYILSLYAYAHTAAYAIDTFNLDRNGVLALLLVSAALLIGIGRYVYE